MGSGTYTELQESLEGIPSNLLSQRLKSLESDGLLESKLYQEHPPRYRYMLTGKGSELNDVFIAISMWGEKHLTACFNQLVHEACGNGIEHQYVCTHCGKTVSPDQLVVHHRKK